MPQRRHVDTEPELEEDTVLCTDRGGCGSECVTVTGILHAAAVRDGGVATVLHPDDGGPPLSLRYGGEDDASVLAALADIVTVCGTVAIDDDGAEQLHLHHIGGCAGFIERLHTATSERG
jgi:hypothetical protein